MLIRIKNTTFGLVVNGIVKPKTPRDPPFEVDEELGYRLVQKGIAEIIGDTESNDKSNDNGNEEDNGESGFGIPQYSENTSKSDLQLIANEYGVEVAAGATKQELIKALDNFFADAMPDDSEEE